MPLENMTPEQVNALGSMSKKIHDEYRNLGFAGITVDPIRYLAFRQQTQNEKYTQLVVSDAGVFFVDNARRMKFRFHPQFFFVYHEGFQPWEQAKIKESGEQVFLMENLLEFWNRPGTGLCLVADHLHKCDYLFPDQKAEMKRIQALYQKEGLVINPMLQKKGVPSSPKYTGVVDLED
jgi:hypothetical protein